MASNRSEPSFSCRQNAMFGSERCRAIRSLDHGRIAQDSGSNGGPGPVRDHSVRRRAPIPESEGPDAPRRILVRGVMNTTVVVAAIRRRAAVIWNGRVAYGRHAQSPGRGRPDLDAP